MPQLRNRYRRGEVSEEVPFAPPPGTRHIKINFEISPEVRQAIARYLGKAKASDQDVYNHLHNLVSTYLALRVQEDEST